jgi:hypothetical protein
VTDVDPTFYVTVWLANDEPLHRRALELAWQVHEAGVEGMIGRDPRHELADELAEWVRGLVPDVVSASGVIADLISWALANVRWAELADDYLGTVRSGAVSRD